MVTTGTITGMKRGLLLACLIALFGLPASAGEDRHAGYYYPTPTTVETYGARTISLPEATRQTRLGFIIGITQTSLSRPYPPRIVMFAKGDQAQKLIINPYIGLNIDNPSVPGRELKAAEDEDGRNLSGQAGGAVVKLIDEL